MILAEREHETILNQLIEKYCNGEDLSGVDSLVFFRFLGKIGQQ
jgi:hypothetical protein